MNVAETPQVYAIVEPLTLARSGDSHCQPEQHLGA